MAQLDGTANLVHGYGLAQLLSTYSGNIVRLRRSTDDDEADFGNDGSGNLDTASTATWLGGATGYVVTLYDQASGDHVTQATAAQQPLFVANAPNGRPSLGFDGTLRYLQGPYTIGGQLSQPVSEYVVAKMDASLLGDGISHSIVDGYPGVWSGWLQKYSSEYWVQRWGVYQYYSVARPDVDWHVFSMLANGVASDIWVDGVGEGPADAGIENPTGMTIGARQNGLSPWNGYICAVIVCDPSHNDTQRQAVESALDTYWISGGGGGGGVPKHFMHYARQRRAA